MTIQQVGGNSDIPEYKSPDDIILKPADAYNTQKIGNTLAGIEQGVDRDLETAVIKNDENIQPVLKKWLSKSKKILDSIANIVSTTYEGYVNRLEIVIKKLEKHIKPEQEQNSYEPVETDSRQCIEQDTPSRETDITHKEWIKNNFGAVPDVHKYDGEEGDTQIENKIKEGQTSDACVKAAHQKKYTKKEYINHLIIIGYSKKEAEKMAKENNIS